MKNKYFIVLDIETTGLSPEKGFEITEIGAIKVDSKTYEIVDTFSRLCRITKSKINPFIQNLTGISNELLEKEGVDLNIVLSDLDKFVGDLTIYAHNSDFDKGFIRHYLKDLGIKYNISDWIDTLPLIKSHFTELPNHKLETVIKVLDIAESEDHRAVSDATHTLSVLKVIWGVDKRDINYNKLPDIRDTIANKKRDLVQVSISEKQFNFIKSLVKRVSGKSFNSFKIGDVLYIKKGVSDSVKIPLEKDGELLKKLTTKEASLIIAYLLSVLDGDSGYKWLIGNKDK